MVTRRQHPVNHSTPPGCAYHNPSHTRKGKTITTATAAITAATAQDITGNIWLSRPEAAAYLGCSAKTLAQHLHDGPTYSKFFGMVKYRLTDLDNWARQQQVRR